MLRKFAKRSKVHVSFENRLSIRVRLPAVHNTNSLRAWQRAAEYYFGSYWHLGIPFDRVPGETENL
jgi:hypothetical protein